MKFIYKTISLSSSAIASTMRIFRIRKRSLRGCLWLMLLSFGCATLMIHALLLVTELQSRTTTTSEITVVKQRSRILLIIPTVPYFYKGSDHRLLHIIKYLSSNPNLGLSLGYYVKLQDDTPTANESDALIVKQLRSQFKLDIIYGPLHDYGFAGGCTHHFDIIMYWHWYNLPYMNMLIRSVQQFHMVRGQTRVLAFVDDDTVALRSTAPSLLKHISRDEIESVVLSLRSENLVSNIVRTRYGIPYLLQIIQSPYNIRDMVDAELRSYQHADEVVPISSHQTFIQRFVEGQRFDVLRYSIRPLSPSYILPTQAPIPAKHIMFIGYNNLANNAGIKWFVNEVLPLLRTTGVILHVIGYVQCTKAKSLANNAKVICEGKQSDVDTFFRRVSLAINPSNEESGVATKTCDALKRGIPVVTNTFDGTVKSLNSAGSIERYGVAICQIKDPNCTASSIDLLLNSQNLWMKASKAAVHFMNTFYGEQNMFSDFDRILNRTISKNLRVLILSDNQNPHYRFDFVMELTRILSHDDRFTVYSIGTAANFTKGSNNGNRTYLNVGAVPTGMTFHYVLQLTWPPNFSDPPTRMCGARCRLVLWLPWQLKNLPEKLKNQSIRYDAIWTPSEYDARLLEGGGVDRLRIHVMPEGIKCNPPLKQASWLSSLQWNFRPFRFVYFGEDISLFDFEQLTTAFRNARQKTHYTLSLTLFTYSGRNDISSDVIVQVEHLLSMDEGISWSSANRASHETGRILESADAIILPSCAINPGMSLIKALSYGVPVIHANSLTTFNRKGNISFPVRSHIVDCTSYPCKSDSLCIPCHVNSPCCLKTKAQPRCNLMEEASLQETMVAVATDRVDAVQRGINGQVFARKTNCWEQLAPIYKSDLMHLIVSPNRAVIGSREKGMFISPYRIVGPYFFNILNPSSAILRSPSGKWLLTLNENTAQISIQNSFEGDKITWMSEQKPDSNCHPTCRLDLRVDCLFSLNDGKGSVVWSIVPKVDSVNERHQCIVELLDDGALRLYSFGKKVTIFWASHW